MPNLRIELSNRLFVGALSGTSVDGIDVSLVQFLPHPKIYSARTVALPPDLQLALRSVSGLTPLSEAARLDVRVGRCFAEAVLSLLHDADVPVDHIAAIGSHGQTIWHAPHGDVPYTVQIGDPNVIAQMTGITTVADFRRRDLAAGGQGAPLVPAFHQAVFSSAREARCILNLGGIANVTLLPQGDSSAVLGFDTGPANTLLDAWARRHLGKNFDAGGTWAASGRLNAALLERLVADDYFQRSAPKSTGPEYFNVAWLEERLAGFPRIAAADVQATLAELTAHSIATAIERSAPDTAAVFVCGGGIHNAQLIARLRERLAPRRLSSTSELGVDPDYVEAAAFAWLARQTMLGMAGNLPAVTGARQEVVLGGIFTGAPAGAPVRTVRR